MRVLMAIAMEMQHRGEVQSEAAEVVKDGSGRRRRRRRRRRGGRARGRGAM